MQGQYRVITPYQSKDPSPTIPIYRKKEEKGKTIKQKVGEQLRPTYFILAVHMQKCLGKRSCLSFTFHVALLNEAFRSAKRTIRSGSNVLLNQIRKLTNRLVSAIKLNDIIKRLSLCIVGKNVSMVLACKNFSRYILTLHWVVDGFMLYSCRLVRYFILFFVN